MFEVKAKINFSKPSGVINRPKLTHFYIKLFLLLVHSVARTRFDERLVQKSDFKYLGNENILCLLCSTDCPVFEVKAKINVSKPSGVINRPKLTHFYIKLFLLLVHSVARTRFDERLVQKSDFKRLVQKSDFKYLDFLVQYANVVFFHCSKEM